MHCRGLTARSASHRRRSCRSSRWRRRRWAGPSVRQRARPLACTPEPCSSRRSLRPRSPCRRHLSCTWRPRTHAFTPPTRPALARHQRCTRRAHHCAGSSAPRRRSEANDGRFAERAPALQGRRRSAGADLEAVQGGAEAMRILTTQSPRPSRCHTSPHIWPMCHVPWFASTPSRPRSSTLDQGCSGDVPEAPVPVARWCKAPRGGDLGLWSVCRIP